MTVCDRRINFLGLIKMLIFLLTVLVVRMHTVLWILLTSCVCLLQCGSFSLSSMRDANIGFHNAGLSQLCYDQPGCVGEPILNGTTKKECCEQNGTSILNNGNCAELQCSGKWVITFCFNPQHACGTHGQ